MKIRRILKTYINGYIPNEYWEERGKKYKTEFVSNDFYERQEEKLLNYLKTIEFETVLEVGCGFGRITKKVLSNFPVKKYIAIDLSDVQIENAKKNCKDYNNIQFKNSTIQNLKIDDKFDLVLGVEVLLHVLPEEINKVIKKLASLSNDHIINIDFNSNYKPRIVLPHNFTHDYKKIYSDEPTIKEFIEIPIDEKHSIYHSQVLFEKIVS